MQPARRSSTQPRIFSRSCRRAAYAQPRRAASAGARTVLPWRQPFGGVFHQPVGWPTLAGRRSTVPREDSDVVEFRGAVDSRDRRRTYRLGGATTVRRGDGVVIRK